MSLIDRYRRRGGFLQLLNTIETSTKEKQEKFLSLIRDESPLWESTLMTKLLTLEKVFTWGPELHQEIFPRLPVLQLWALLSHLPGPWSEQAIRALGPKEKRQVEEQLEMKKSTSGEFFSATMKLFTEIRKLEAEGVFRFERVLPEMAIAENIEEWLRQKEADPSALKDAPEATFSEDTQLDYATSNSIKPANKPAPIAGDAAPAKAASGAVASNVADEIAMLRKKLVQISQENARLQSENTLLKQKLDSIRKIA